jgi:hypothetical protein
MLPYILWVSPPELLVITPNNGLSDGVDQEFTMQLEYDLSTQPQAEIWIGFNS